jgi:hypothetical protein
MQFFEKPCLIVYAGSGNDTISVVSKRKRENNEIVGMCVSDNQ